jgi:alkanesulfonate monooxygenase SsuD/methylene tetrahydromethanopterin reductase-like flavin-dependent oxidoreductase (luciferase family)
MTDPVLERRERMARLAATGQRLGYGAILVAVVAFVWALAASFPGPATALVAIGMGVATVTLAPAIVLGYAVKAAKR